MEKPWNICGKTDMEKLWKTNTLENCRLGKTKDALKWSGTRNRLERWKNVSENCKLGEHRKRQGGFDWNYLGRGWNNRGKTVLLFGVPSDWIPCEHMEHFQVGKIRAD